MMDICSKMTDAQWKEARNATWIPRMLPASWTKRFGKPSCRARRGAELTSAAREYIRYSERNVSGESGARLELLPLDFSEGD